MNHEKLELESVAKMFEFEKLSRELDNCSDINQLKDICKCYIKLYFKQQETLISLVGPFGSK
jgi:hypothetical protein